MAAQVWTQVDEHRRQFLAANGGKAFSVRFIPSTVIAYFRPDGLRITDVFPFITLPATPPRAIGHAVLDMTYRTASVPASMPLFFLLGIWGTVTTFKRRAVGRIALLRIPILAATAGTVGVFVWGYIADRYLSDFIPLLFLASAVGIADVWRRLDSRPRRLRTGVTAVVSALAVFGIVSNVAIASTPGDVLAWKGSLVQRYVQRQESLSTAMGNPISANVLRGSQLPATAPADKLFVLNNCAALYLSNGEQYNPWIPVAFGSPLEHVFTVSFYRPATTIDQIPLLAIGRNLVSTLALQYRGRQVRLLFSDPLFPAVSNWITVKLGRMYRITADADIPRQDLSVEVDGQTVISSTVSSGEMNVTAFSLGTTESVSEPLTITAVHIATPPLCRPLMSAIGKPSSRAEAVSR
jgi:hypothetical protein